MWVGGLSRVAVSDSGSFESKSLHTCNLRSGSLAFPAPSSILPVTRLILEGFPKAANYALFSFAPLQSSSRDAPIGSTDLLSWDSSREVPRRRHRCRDVTFPPDPCPSIDSLPGVHSRDDVATATSGSRDLPEHRVPTSWFRTTSPVSSAVRPIAGTAVPSAFAKDPGVTGLLHPAADLEVRRVSARSIL